MSADEAIDYFYKIKGRYDTKYNVAKLRIVRNNISIEEKRKRIRVLKVRCVNCKRSVGTLFSTKDRHLKAVCGDTANPCQLNIDINLGISDSIDNLSQYVSSSLHIIKVNIIETKLMLLFDLIDEEAMEASFLDLKKTYKELVEIEQLIEDHIKEQNMITIRDVGGEREIERTTLAAANEVKLGNLIGDFKRLIKEYEADDSADTKLTKMTDAIDSYLSQILPTNQVIKDTIYPITTVIKDKEQYKLIQIKVPLSERIIELEKPEIISNKK